MSNFARVLVELKSERKRTENELHRIDDAISALRGLGARGTNGTRTAKGMRRGPRRLSAAARKRISMAQKARWAKYKQLKKAA